MKNRSPMVAGLLKGNALVADWFNGTLSKWIPALKKKPAPVDISLSQRRAYDVLFEAMRNHSLIYVRPVSGRVTFQSVLLDVNLKEQYLLIDELFPDIGYQVVQHDRFEVSIGKSGFSMNFVAELLMHGEYAGTPFYKLSLPEILEERQRRSTYRVELPMNISAKAEWRWPDGLEGEASIADISMSGVKLTVKNDVPRVQVGTVLPGVEIRIGNDLKLRSDIDVKHIEVDKSNKESVVSILGGQLTAVEPIDHMALQRYMHRLQRANRRQQLSAMDR